MKSLPIPLFVIDDLIKRGRTAKAKEGLRRFCKGRVKREHRLAAAALARRMEMPDLGIALLHPLVRPLGKRVQSEATPQEIAEYAADLSRLGAPREALELLTSKPVVGLPEAGLYQAFALVSLWEYGATIPLLERFLEVPNADPYQRLVAQANLAAAFLFVSRFGEADKVLTSLESKARETNFHLLLGHALKLRAQWAISIGDSSAAERALSLAEKQSAEWAKWDELLLKKWRAVLALKKEPKKAILELEQVQTLAEKASHWETVRDCAGYLAVATQDEARLWRVFFGTPFAPFREKLLVDFGYRGAPPTSYLLPGGKEKATTLDLTGAMDLGADLVPEDARFRLLRALASDFFRPFRGATLFQLIHPEELYNPLTSPPRVRMLVMRLRRSLTKKRFRAGIEHLDDGYRLSPRCPLRVDLAPNAETRSVGLVERASTTFGEDDFGLKEAAKVLDVSDRTLGRALTDAMHEGRLQRAGKGRATRYRFKAG